MFFGEHEHSIDDKNRLTLPARFRDLLADGVVLARGLEGQVDVYPREGWRVNVESRLAELDSLSREARDLRRFFYAGMADCELDKQGRVLVPPALARHASLEKAVVTAGVYDHLARIGGRLREGLVAAGTRHGFAVQAPGEDAVFGLRFTARRPLRTWMDLTSADKDLGWRFAMALLARGLLVNPNHQATACIIGMVLAVGLAVEARGRVERGETRPHMPWWYAGLAGCLLLIVPLSTARAGMPIAFASLALQFPDLAVQQLEHAFKKLGLRGAAIGAITSAPTPLAHSMGASPTIAVASVKNFGRKRCTAPLMTAFFNSSTDASPASPPRSSIASLKYTSMMMPVSVAMPKQAMYPTHTATLRFTPHR